jgi:pimeloyl-ACP methyl ester carboxylesterase
MRLAVALLFSIACHIAAAASGDVGAILVHGKWATPDGPIASMARALEKEGYVVAAPEMPWSRAGSYNGTIEQADSMIDAQIAKLKAAGAKRVVLIGHSLGAAYGLHYAGRSDVDAVVAIAPGHRPESPRFASLYAADVKRARELVADGKSAEIVTFTDLNTGNRRARMTASAASFVSYFDPEGPMNMGRNAEAVKAATPVLWLVPTREESPLREGNLALYKRLPQNPRTQSIEPDADHLQAPAASVPVVIEWLRKTVER